MDRKKSPKTIKNWPLVPPCLDHGNLSLSVMLMKEVPFPKPAIKTLRGSAGLAETTPRTQNVLAQGQSEAHRNSKLYYTIVGNCAASQALMHLKFLKFFDFAATPVSNTFLKFSID